MFQTWPYNVPRTIVGKVSSSLFYQGFKYYDHQLTDNQYGFRQNHGTNDATFVTKQFQQITNDQSISGFLLFIDLSDALLIGGQQK